MKKNIFNLICLSLFTSLLIGCVSSSNTVYKEKTNNIVTSTTNTKSIYEPEGISHKSWDKLSKKYKEIAGYIEIDGCDIKKMVFKHAENNYYLKHNELMESDSKGAIQVESKCDLLRENQVTTILGHNFDDGTMFSNLTNFLNIDFIRKYNTIKFDTKYRKGEYMIFSVFVLDIDKYDFLYRVMDYPYQKRFLSVVEELKTRSWFDINVNIQENDKLLCLYTCYHPINTTDECRLIIMARKCRTGEMPSILDSNISTNSNIKYYTN